MTYTTFYIQCLVLEQKQSDTLGEETTLVNAKRKNGKHKKIFRKPRE